MSAIQELAEVLRERKGIVAGRRAVPNAEPPSDPAPVEDAGSSGAEASDPPRSEPCLPPNRACCFQLEAQLSDATLRAVKAEASRAKAWKRIEELEADAAHLCAEWTATAEHWLAAETELASLRAQLTDKEAENECLRMWPRFMLA